jgi:hypothetical protein
MSYLYHGFVYANKEQASKAEITATSIREAINRTVYTISEVGRSLDAMRSLLGTLFSDWIDHQFGWSMQTVRNYIGLSELVDRNPKVLAIRQPSLIYRLVNLPEEVQDEIIEEQPRTLKEAGEMIDDHKRREWAEAVESEIPKDPGAALQAIEKAMDSPTYREVAIDIMREHAETFAAHAERDTWEVMAEAGMKRAERLPSQSPTRLQLYEGEDNHSLVAWAGNEALTIATFPRQENLAGRAWQNAVIACICERFDVKDEVL